jgi:aminoglycoside phosphotransferase (APT) family kinase protein
VLEAAFAWLERNIPAMGSSACLVHGDVSFRNTLIKDGKLVALLDWEFHHLGDPVEDLSYFRLVAEPFIAWPQVVATYQAAGGPAYDESRARFYEVWRSTRNAVTTATAWHGFVRGHYPASKAAYQGLSLHRFFLRDVADKLETVL